MKTPNPHQAIFEAADALLAAGTQPTVRKVRERLGGGSPNRLAPALQAWRAARLPLPEQVADEAALGLLRQYAQRAGGLALREAQAQLAALRDDQRQITEELLALHARLDEAEAQTRVCRERAARAEGRARVLEAELAKRDRWVARSLPRTPAAARRTALSRHTSAVRPRR